MIRAAPLLALFAAVALLSAPAPAAAQGAAGEPLRPVKLTELTAGPDRVQRQFFGRVRARETVDLAFQVGGQIVEFPVAEGSKLDRGETVAALDPDQFERELRRAEVNLAKAERDLQRLQELSGSAVSDVEIRDARTRRDLARIAVEEAREALDDATLEARFDALVARREVATFATVAAGEPVVRLHDMSELRVDIDVPEVLFRRASASDEVTFEATFPGMERSFDLALREFEAETAEVAQTFSLTLAFTEEMPGWVLPGASVTVTASAPRPGGGDTILLPETALVFDAAGDPGVMVFEPSAEASGTGTVRRVPVGIEMRADARVALTEGPPPGTPIVAAGASQLRDGQRVRRFTGIGG